MPRSVNPHNYDGFFWELCEGMQAHIPVITLDLPASKAQRVRWDFWAFIRALEKHAEKLSKEADMTQASDVVQRAQAMRGYLATIFLEDKEQDRIKAGDVTPMTLKFINRDMNPATADIREQLAKQLDGIEAPETLSEADMALPILATDSFFDKPLELKDHDGD